MLEQLDYFESGQSDEKHGGGRLEPRNGQSATFEDQQAINRRENKDGLSIQGTRRHPSDTNQSDERDIMATAEQRLSSRYS